MNRTLPRLAALAALALSAPPLAADVSSGFDLTVLVGGVPRPEYASNGTLYVEALRGREYALRITNPLPRRVAVALSVDGLNTLDARHTGAWDARKWVLGPYETVVISGWQVSQAAARKFTFTGERSSYGARLGQTDNLGVIEAVFYAEKPRPWELQRRAESERRKDASGAGGLGGVLGGTPGADSRDAKAQSGAAAPAPPLSDEYAATGMGNRTRHEVQEVSIDLGPEPVATVRIRYEFRPALLKLGVLPAPENPSPLERREGSRGFESFCPEPGR